MTSDLLIPFAQLLPGCKAETGLYIVATPIGHLSDISLRALAILSQVDLIACEDTRVTSKLLKLYNIKKPLISYHIHNAYVSAQKIIHHIQNGKCVALVSDAGTPLISDPGFGLVAECLSKEIYVTSIPGPSAAITALTLSGLPTDRFTFLGFLSAKSTARQKELIRYSSYPETLILYEAPHRVKGLLEDVLHVLGDRSLIVARELTKKFEDVRRGKASEILQTFRSTPPKGEFVIVISGAHSSTSSELNDISDNAIMDLLHRLTTKDAADHLSKTYGVSKKELYQRIIELKK